MPINADPWVLDFLHKKMYETVRLQIGLHTNFHFPLLKIGSKNHLGPV